MRNRTLIKQLTLGVAIAAISQISFAQAPQGRVYGDGIPFGLSDLAPSRAREKLESLPGPAQARALEWLNSFSFHESDLEFISFDGEGGVFYQDTVLPDTTEQAQSTQDSLSFEAAADVFVLHSKPGSSNILFIDFDGHEISDTAWNYHGEPTYSASAFNTEGDDGTFSSTERAQIQEIWHRIAEDFAPFDIDVTTEQPATFNSTTGRVLITRSVDTTGQPMPSSSAGGVAYVGAWGRSDYSYYSPAMVYYDNLSSATYYIAEAASHEAGHNLSLSHDGDASSSYYSGHGSGYVSWAPIMGVGYYNNVTQWSKGEYSGATQTQDDLSIITGHIGLRNDDHSDTSSASTELTLTGGSLIEVSNPETDPANLYSGNKGIIEDRTDVDTFTFVTGGGTVDINATPAWDAFYRSNKRGANLDIELTLLDDSGMIATSDPVDDTSAQILASVSAGRYYLKVTGVGNAISPYSDYGSLGQYFLSGAIPASGGGDTTAPNPDQMTWSAMPSATDRVTVEMTASTATDDSGTVEYQFVCVAGGPNCSISAWQSSTFYSASNLTAGTTYSFEVSARDLSNNVTLPSTQASATTPANISPTANDDSASTDQDNAVSIAVLANDTDPEGDTLSVVSVGSGLNGSTSTDGSTVTYTPDGGFSGTDSFSYTTGDGFGGNDSALVTITVIALETNTPPIARDDATSLTTETTVQIPVLRNDSDADYDQLTIVSVTRGKKGVATVSGNTITYTAGKKPGSDTLSYTISDGQATSTATISVSLTGDTGGGGGDKCHPRRGC